MYVPFRIRKFMLRCWQSIEVPICCRWLDKTVEPWRSMTVSLNEFLLGHLKVLWNEPRQKKYKVHTGFWYVCSNIYIYIYIRYRIFLHMLIWWNSSNNIYIYIHVPDQPEKKASRFFSTSFPPNTRWSNLSLPTKVMQHAHEPQPLLPTVQPHELDVW